MRFCVSVLDAGGFVRSVSLLGLIWLAAVAAALPAAAQTAPAPTQAAPPKLSPEQLDQLCAPIALYPDALLAQVLMASAYPLDVVAADRFMQKNGSLTGDQMESALQNEPWDVSVKTLTHFPSVLKYMDDNLDWMQALGDAFVNQQPDVMASVQRLRAEAYAAGNLKSTPQQTVQQSGGTIAIVPADGQTIYVPQYNPTTIYTQGPTTVVTGSGATTVVTQPSTTVVTQPGYSTGALVATGLLSFTAGVVVGSLINNDWCDWSRGYVYVPAYRGPGYGWAGWGRPPPGWGYNGWNRPVHYGNTNINITNNINNGSIQRWQPNNNRRPNAYSGRPTTRPAANDFGYGKPNQPRPNQAGAGAFSGYGRGSTALQDSARGAQSLGGSRPHNKPPGAAGSLPSYKPPANKPPINKPPAVNRSFSQGGGFGGGVFGGGNGALDRAASHRGFGSMGSAQHNGFRPPARLR